jgi:hypothetical protein
MRSAMDSTCSNNIGFSVTKADSSLLSQTALPTSDLKTETFLVKLYQIVRQRANQENDNLCKLMIEEAFQTSEVGSL